MLKSQVPVYFCSIAFIMATPPAANPNEPSFDSGKSLHTNSKTKSVRFKTNKIVLPLANKQSMKFVRSYIRNNDECLDDVKQRSEMPFAIIDSVLNHYSLPLELKYLAVIESELKPSAVSRVGAKGPWQLMPQTAHVLGLKVNHRSDERVNYYKSTRAAARYLRDLHREFGDWLLVLAAYNGGPGPVYKAIHKSHSKNFWTLQKYLPAESREHVKKFIATAYYFEQADSLRNANKPEETAALVMKDKPQQPIPETANEKFSRLMSESARSLKTSNELLEASN